MRSCGVMWVGAWVFLWPAAAQKAPVSKLLEMARSEPNSARFREALVASLGEAEIRKGTAILGEGADFIWAVESEKFPSLYVDGLQFGTMARAAGGKIWFHAGALRTGTSHEFHYQVEGARWE